MRLPPYLAAALLLAAAASPEGFAADRLITFEEAGLTAMANSPGAAVPVASRLHDQFLATFGVSFSSGSAFVAVVDHGCCTPSGTHIIGGTTVGGALSYGTPITISFFDPANPALFGVTDFVRIRGDFTSIAGTATMTAFGVAGNSLGSVTANDNPLGVDLVLSVAGIHSVSLTQTSATIGLDNLEFDNVVGITAAVPEPETYALLLGGLALVGWAARRRARPACATAVP